MSSIKFNTAGFKELERRLKQAPLNVQKEIAREVRDAADTIVRNAKRDAPKDEGRLAGEISAVKLDDYDYAVVSPVEYSPYVEWGTKRRVKVPPELASYAITFKGKGTGSAAEFLKAIMGWVKRKGIRYDSASRTKGGKHKKLTPEQTAYIIFHYLLITGIKPHPYFFKNYDKQFPILFNRIKAVLKDI